MQPYQIKRIQILWDEEMQKEEILGIYMQQYLGKKSLGSGKITGLGIFGIGLPDIPIFQERTQSAGAANTSPAESHDTTLE